MIKGLSKDELDIIFREVIEPLKSINASVWIFGSRARGDFKKYSDIDILYKEEENYPAPSGFIYDIELSLEESKLPYKVELVNVNNLAESYRNSVMRDRLLL